LSITEEGDPSSKKIILEKIESTSSGLRAKVRVFVKTGDGLKLKTIKIKHGDNLTNKTNNNYYDGFIVNEINKAAGYISFSNGIKIYEGKSSVDEDEIVRFMIRETIREHLEKKKKLNPKGIKVLSLFFLNKVDDYLLEDGIVRKMFKEEFEKFIKNGFQEFSNLDVNAMHSGYFSKMKKDKSIEEDESAYDLIMKDKERLLSLDEPVEFIFSHSALREGWDNPNVFNICTLAYSSSEIKKRQEIGRGLRLPVDQNGNRIQNRDINLLTVITNESYRDYIEKLQTEYRDEAGIEAPPVEERKKRVIIKRKDDVFKGDLFKNLWDKISQKAKYIVNLDVESFVKECINKIQEIDVVEPAVYIEKVRVDKLDQDEIEKNFVRETSESIRVKKVLNLVSNIEKETNLTKRTILEILKGCNNFNKYFLNPQVYEERVIKAINECKKNYEVQGIAYINLDEKYSNDLFKEELTSYIDYILKVNKSVYDSVIIESNIEENFAKSLDQDSRVKLFLKLPDWYIIETPAGNYTPDWAIVVERVQNGVSSEKIYFVVENKGTNEIYELRTDEKIKIESAKKRFSASLVHNLKFIAPIKDFESFKNQW